MSTAKWITDVIEAGAKSEIVVMVDNDSLYVLSSDDDDYNDAEDIEIPGPRQALRDLLAHIGIESTS